MKCIIHLLTILFKLSMYYKIYGESNCVKLLVGLKTYSICGHRNIIFISIIFILIKRVHIWHFLGSLHHLLHTHILLQTLCSRSRLMLRMKTYNNPYCNYIIIDHIFLKTNVSVHLFAMRVQICWIITKLIRMINLT